MVSAQVSKTTPRVFGFYICNEPPATAYPWEGRRKRPPLTQFSASFPHLVQGVSRLWPWRLGEHEGVNAVAKDSFGQDDTMLSRLGNEARRGSGRKLMSLR